MFKMILSLSRTKITVLGVLLFLSYGHAQQQKLAENNIGSVSIRTKFPGGNVHVEKNRAGTIHVAPDLRGDNPWFYWYFEAKATQPGRVTFVFPKKVIGFKNGAIGYQGPAISADQGKTWQWMGTETVQENTFYYDFKKAGEEIRFAVTIPYVQTNLDRFLEKYAKNPHLKRSVLTKSRAGRKVDLLRIGTPGPNKIAVLMTARHHAVETMASYVLEGILQEAMSDSPDGNAFRKKYVLFVVPIVDRDGVEKGDQGKNRKPVDYNRDYGEKSIHPEVRAIKQLHAKQKFRITLDFHCPTLVMKDHQVMYFIGPKEQPEHNFENVSAFAERIKSGLPKSAPYGPLVWLRTGKKFLPMNSYYFAFQKGVLMAATLEFPFAPPGKATDPASCRRYGQIILQAFAASRFSSTPEK